MDTFFLTVTWLGSLYLLTPLALLIATVLWYQQQHSDALLLLLGLGFTSLCCHGLKMIFARPRPQVEELLVTMPSDFSFPSAHTAQAMAFALACWLIFSRKFGGGELWMWSSLFIGLTLVVAISRVYLRVHYVSDVIAGGILGSFVVLLVYRILTIMAGKG